MQHRNLHEGFSCSRWFGQRFRAAGRFVPLVVLILLAVFVSGFRISNNTPEAIIERYEENFQVSTQAELYKAVIIGRDGNALENDMLVLYRYQENAVYGLFRLLHAGANTGYTVLSIQRRGQLPQLYVYDPGIGEVRDVSARGLDERLGGSPWNLEDILDDDKEEWFFRDLGVANLRGVDCNVVEARFALPELQSRSAYRKRRYYFARDDSRAMQVQYFDHHGVHLKTLTISGYEYVAGDKTRQLRARRLEINHYQDEIVMVMTRVKSAYDKPLRDEWFAPESLENWTSDMDAEVIGLMK